MTFGLGIVFLRLPVQTYVHMWSRLLIRTVAAVRLAIRDFAWLRSAYYYYYYQSAALSVLRSIRLVSPDLG